MSEIVILLDINGQKTQNINTLMSYLKTLDTYRIVFTGAFGLMGNWRKQFEAALGSPDKVEALAPSSNRAGAIIDLSLWAAHQCQNDPKTRDCQWLVISKTSGMRSVCDYLAGQGVQKTAWCPAPTADFLSSYFMSEDAVGDTIVLVAKQMLTKNRNQPILIGQVANKIVEMLPEMRDKEYRSRLFGAEKFQQICTNLGMKTQNKYILSVQ